MVINMSTISSALPSCLYPLPPTPPLPPPPPLLTTIDVITAEAPGPFNPEFNFDLSAFKLPDVSFVFINKAPKDQIQNDSPPPPPETININFDPAELANQVRQANKTALTPPSSEKTAPPVTRIRYLDNSTPAPMVTSTNKAVSSVILPRPLSPSSNAPSSPSLIGRVKRADQSKCWTLMEKVLFVALCILIAGIIALAIYLGPPKLQALPPFLPTVTI